MKVLALTLILISTSLAGSDETFQMDNAVGLWKTLDYPFATSELLITADEGGKTLSLVYCNINTEFTGKCEQVYTYTGKISYSAQGDNLLVEKGPSSPTPKYEMQIFKGPSLMRMKRSWGSQTIGYFKIK